MTAETAPVYLIGISDPFVFEILDAMEALGIFPTLVPTHSLISSDRPAVGDKSEFVSFSDIKKESLIFTGEDSISHENTPHIGRGAADLRELVNLQSRMGLSNWINVIHPKAWCSPRAELAVDIFVGANSSIGAATQIDSHVRINRNVSIGHNVVIGEGTRVSPCAAISSGSVLGRECSIGAGAVILNGIRIGDGAIIGAGSVVTKDVNAGETVIGVPAKPMG